MTINLLDWRAQQHKQHRLILNMTAVICLIIAAIVLSCTYLHCQQSLVAQRHKIAALNHAIAKIPVSDAPQRFQLLQQQIAYARQQHQDLYRLLALLYDSQQSLPALLYLTAVEWHAPWLILQGISFSTDALNRWQQLLRDNKFVQQINPAYRHITQGTQTYHQFILKIALK